MRRREGGKRKEGLTENHSANRVTHPKSECSSDWITHNTTWRYRSYEQTDRHGEATEIFHRCFGFMWYFYGQRRREEFKKTLEDALKFFMVVIESCCVGVEGSSESICVRRSSPSALSVFRFHLSLFPTETPDTQGIMCMAIVNWSLKHAPKFCTEFSLTTSQSPTLMVLTAVFSVLNDVVMLL